MKHWRDISRHFTVKQLQKGLRKAAPNISHCRNHLLDLRVTQIAFTCSKSTRKTVEKRVKYVQS